MSSVLAQVARHERAVNNILFSSNGKPVIVSVNQETLVKINDSLFYASDITRNLWLRYEAESNERGVRRANQNGFANWASDPATILSPVERRLAAGFLPNCGSFSFFFFFPKHLKVFQRYLRIIS
jgi:hypothetical protein